MLGGWLKGGGKPIGIDIGAHSVKLLQLQRVDGGGSNGSTAKWTAVAAARQSLPADLPEHGPQRNEALVRAISMMLDGGDFNGRKCVSCLPATALRYKNLRLPKMPADELKAAVEWEAADRLKLTASTVQLQFYDAGEVTQGDESREEIILLVAPNEVLDEHLQVLTQCGLDPVAIDAVPGALARAVGGYDTTDLEAPADVIIDVGYSATKVLILRNGRVVFFKLIDIGGHKLDQIIAHNLGMPIAEVGELRRRLQHDAAGDEAQEDELLGSSRRESTQRAVYEAQRSVIGELSREIGLCLRYYSVTFRGKRPEMAKLVGGEAHEPHLASLLAEGANLHIERCQPLAAVDTASIASVLKRQGNGCQWACVMGLALRGAEHSALKANLGWGAAA